MRMGWPEAAGPLVEAAGGEEAGAQATISSSTTTAQENRPRSAERRIDRLPFLDSTAIVTSAGEGLPSDSQWHLVANSLQGIRPAGAPPEAAGHLSTALERVQ